MKTKVNLLELLKNSFGFDSFRPNQEQIISGIMCGQDALAIMPTGGGKSICYQLPALALPGTAVVISPLIALMKDQVDALRANGIAASYYNSSQPPEIQMEAMQAFKAGELKLMYVAPESLRHILALLSTIKVSLFAIDEAHCISSWGHDFRPAYTRLGFIKTKFPEIPMLALTATADTATQDDITKQLNIPDATKHIASFDRKNLYLEVRPGKNKNKQILNFLESHQDESGIIYCLSRNSTEKLAAVLQKNGYSARSYHAGLSSEERSEIQEDFINDRTPIIVATIAFGMGIDKSIVRWVIHNNLPKNIESFYQEIGRSGRDNLPANTLLFYSYADVRQLQKFIRGTPTEKYQLAKLERMQQFAEALSCRRIALLNYFGEHVVENCGNCDNCKTPPKFFDGTLLAQKVCSAVARLREQESLGTLVDVLRGSQNASIYEKRYHTIKTYGALKDVPWLELHQYVIQMINQGILEIRFHQKGRLLLTPLARAILYEERSVKLATLIQENKAEKKEKVTRENTGSLFDKLRKLRTEISLEEKVPAYIVLSDASLKNMEDRLPGTEEEFAQISGVGKVKQEKYALRFLKAIAAHQQFQESLLPTHEQSLKLIKDGLSPEEIAEQRELKPETVYGHLLKGHQEGKYPEIEKYIQPGELSSIKKAKSALDEPDGLKPYFKYFNGKMPYWKIKFGLYELEKKAHHHTGKNLRTVKGVI